MTAGEDTRPGAQRVLAVVRAARDGITATAVASQVGLHVTTVRFHLDRLAAEGQVRANPVPSGGRGRPSLVYQAIHTPNARAAMLTALADAAAGSGPAARRAQQAGESWAASLDLDDRPVQDQLIDVFGQLGFAPSATPEGVALRSCPFLDDAHKHPEVVCGVHRGLALGIARRAGGTVTLKPFEGELCTLALD